MIEEIYKVSVVVPEDVWEKHQYNREYERRTIQATRGSIESGSDSYSTPYEWATFYTKKEAEDCETALQEVMRYFQIERGLDK